MANPIALPTLLAVVSALASGLRWQSAPAHVPIWWNSHGQPLASVPKWVGLCTLPLLQLLLPYLWYQLAARDRALEQQGGEAKHAAAQVICTPALFLFMLHNIVLLDSATNGGQQFHVRFLIASVAVWLLFWYGYNIQYVDLNSTIGILSPWTVADARTWNNTQAHAGGVLMLCGVLLFILSLVCPIGKGILIATLALCIFPYLYSFIYSYFASSKPGDGDRLLE